MRGSKALALPLLLLMMLGAMGLSYAWWTETLVIDDNVNTGDVDVEFVILPHKMDYPYAYMKSPCTGWFERGYGPSHPSTKCGVTCDVYYDTTEKFTITGDPHKMWISIQNMYPGVHLQFNFGIMNKGTIPVKLKQVIITKTSGSDALFNALECYAHAVLRDEAGNRAPPDNPGWWLHTGWVKLSELADAIEEDFEGIVIMPNWYLEFDGDDEGCLEIRLPSNSGNNLEGTSVTFTIEFEFEQWNGS